MFYWMSWEWIPLICSHTKKKKKSIINGPRRGKEGTVSVATIFRQSSCLCSFVAVPPSLSPFPIFGANKSPTSLENKQPKGREHLFQFKEESGISIAVNDVRTVKRIKQIQNPGASLDKRLFVTYNKAVGYAWTKSRHVVTQLFLPYISYLICCA